MSVGESSKLFQFFLINKCCECRKKRERIVMFARSNYTKGQQVCNWNVIFHWLPLERLTFTDD